MRRTSRPPKKRSKSARYRAKKKQRVLKRKRKSPHGKKSKGDRK